MTYTSAALESVAEVRLGRQRSPKNHAGDQMRPYVRAANVGWDGWLLDDVKSMNFTDGEMDTYRLQPNDLLLGEASGSAHEVGKPAIWEGQIEDCAFQNTLIRVRPRGADARYLLHYFKYAASSGKFAERSRGVGIFHLGRKTLAEWEVPLPPIEEQRRIAALLDAADALRVKRRQAGGILGTLNQAIFVDMFGEPRRNPNRLPKRALGDLIRLKSGTGLTATAMRPGDYKVYGGNGVSGCHDDFMFVEPKIVVGRVGAYCGAVHVSEPKSWITDNALYVMQQSEDIRSSTYLAEALRMANLNQYASQASQPLISGSRVYPIEILVPSASDQLEFENRLGAAFRLRDASEASGAAVERMFASLQQRAFRGEL